MNRAGTHLCLGFVLLCTASCMKYGPSQTEDFFQGGAQTGLFVANEGNFMYGNASLSFYDTQRRSVENEVFARANAISLGDVAQSMTLYEGTLYVVVNNSAVVFAIDPQTFKIKGVITGFVSPRYMKVVSPVKAYVSDLYAGCIWTVNPQTYSVTGNIPTPGHRSTEQMESCGTELFVTCWSYDNTVLVIDTQTDRISDSLTLGQQPKNMVKDKNRKLWVMANGNNPDRAEASGRPVLYRIDPAGRTVERQWELPYPGVASGLCLNGTQDTLYYLNRHVWRMEVGETELPSQPFVPYRQTLFYALAVDPHGSSVYVSDAIDYVQPGVVYRYSAQGVLEGTFTAGIIPGSFCFDSQPVNIQAE